ncbi:lipid droplet-associated hydrolase [Trematomus bernacchii]|uniref:lipid droplet-associated hydrolase n=1 Tax=Trematomus bernacchii TaxID=40690 RepID=UPI00146EBA87|nr:lipid droplet-associated hydrolase [Trematomus bernacchii]XP_034001556.1 lipid droplet-associated hydrolase [Trematomus bernacchii]XP_034001557.1 lipid droplet-associated hydrolase [Trematomus bernacchii]
MDRVETEQRDEPQTDFIYCHRAVTEVLKFGSCQFNSGHKVLFLIIPGNPGVVGFYKTFMRTLHRKLGYHHPVWAVSHAGHCVPPDSMDMVEDASSAAEYDVFGLDGQIEHKLAFLRRHVPRDTRLVLLGHSIGCYIILDMMKRNPELNILKSIMLFPTIERMAQTPQGKVMTPVLCGLRYVAYLPLFLLSLLPEALKAGLIRLALGGICSLDHTVVQPTVGLLSGDCAANAMYMGGQEMKKVLERDDLTIKKNLEKLIFYYGATDHWCPVQYYHDIKQDFPHGDFRLCENGFRHAFVLDAGREVAQMVSEWISVDFRT